MRFLFSAQPRIIPYSYERTQSAELLNPTICDQLIPRSKSVSDLRHQTSSSDDSELSAPNIAKGMACKFA